MNFLHMKYAVEVARVGSINKAAETLLIAQPNLSRCIKELEASLGITIFDRTSKGMYLTDEGEQFIDYAKGILNQIDEVENIFRSGRTIRQRFSISVPRSAYISDAFANFSRSLTSEPAEIIYEETNSYCAMNNILKSGYRLGIVRYAESNDREFKAMLDEKGLNYELITEFSYVVLVSRNSPLAEKENLSEKDLDGYIKIVHTDPYAASLPIADANKEEVVRDASRCISVLERASQYELLAENTDAYMWVSPMSEKLLNAYGLVQKKCTANSKIYKDLLIYKKDYRLSKLDKSFITELCISKRKSMNG